MDIIEKICDENEFADSMFDYSAEKLKTSPIRNFFVGKVVFLTGATGFLGQLYLEKLLRCDVERVFILARAKKSHSARERFKEIFAGTLFARLRQQDPNFIDRFTIIEGDLQKIRLDICDKDMRLLQDSVHIVIHAGADVRFNNKLFDLVKANLRGTREMLRIAEDFKKLQVFAYVSTAYSNCVYGHKIYERFYPPPVDPDDLIAYAERIESCPEDMHTFEELTDVIIKPWPNTYAFSKSLSEEIVRRFGHKFPICIVRPSVVISTYSDPIPGWTNSVFGLNGSILAIGVGIMRLNLGDENILLDVMCADFVTNGTLSAIWVTSKNYANRPLKQALTGTDVIGHDANPQIYSLGTSADSPLTSKALRTMFKSFTKDVSVNKAIWTPCDNFTSSLLLYRYLSIFYHLIPTYFFDFLLYLKGKTERIMPIMRKITEYSLAIAYFSKNEWNLDNANMHRVIDQMTPIDRELFLCDARILSHKFYDWAFLYMQGIRKYIVKEDSLETTQRTKTRLKIAKFIQFFVRTAFYALQMLIIYGLLNGLGIIRAVYG